MTEQVARVGDTVLYTLTNHDVLSINKRRDDADAHREQHRADGSQIHIGHPVTTGQVVPMIVTHNLDRAISGQVILDGNDSHWTAATPGTGPGEYHHRPAGSRTDLGTSCGPATPDRTGGMDIGGAIAALWDGHRVACASWTPGRYLTINTTESPGRLPHIDKHYPNGDVMPWPMSHAAILAQDWVIVADTE